MEQTKVEPVITRREAYGIAALLMVGGLVAGTIVGTITLVSAAILGTRNYCRNCAGKEDLKNYLSTLFSNIKDYAVEDFKRLSDLIHEHGIRGAIKHLTKKMNEPVVENKAAIASVQSESTLAGKEVAASFDSAAEPKAEPLGRGVTFHPVQREVRRQR